MATGLALLAVLLNGGCGERRMVAYPGMSLDEVRARSQRFEDEEVHDNTALGLPTNLMAAQYDWFVLERAGETIVELRDVTAFSSVFQNTLISIEVRAAVGSNPVALFPAARSVLDALRAHGFQDSVGYPPVDQNLTAAFFGPRPTDGQPGGGYHYLGSLADAAGVTVAFEITVMPPNGAWLDVRWELPRDENGRHIVDGPEGSGVR